MNTVTATNLIPSQFAPALTAPIYTTPTSTTTIVDDFTVANNDSDAHTISVYIVPNGSQASPSNLLISALSITANTTSKISQLQNHILNPGDFIAAVASSPNVLVVRGSGREVS